MASYAEMVAADKLAAKKKIEAKKAEKKKLKKIADAKRDAQFKGGTVPTSDKVTGTKKNKEITKPRERGPKVIVRQGTPDQKRGTKVQTATEKKTVKKTAEKKTVKKENKPQPPKMPQSIKDMRAKNDAKKENKTGSKKTAASASNTKDFAKTKKIQEELNKMGADINADGIMGAKTRAAMAKYKAKPTSSEKKTFNSAYSNEKLTTQQRLAEAKEEVANPEKKRAKFNTPKSKKALAAAFKMLKKKK